MTPETFAAFVAAGLGLIFGSFGTVVAWRVPRHEDIVRGRSHCPSCGHEIKAYENIPVFSYLLQLGRCRHCKTRISPRYPFAEAVTAVLFVLSVVHFGVTFRAFIYAALFWVLVVLTVVDLEHKLLPNRIVYPSIVTAAVLFTVDAFVTSDFERITDAGLGVLVFAGFLFLVAFAVPAGMGGGDVKLAILLGMSLGYAGGIGLALVGMFLAFTLGASISVLLMLVGRAGRKTQVPFGPFLAAGAVIAILWGRAILDSYLKSF